MRKCSRISGLFLCILALCVCSCGGGGSSADPMGTGTVALTADATEVQPGGSCTLTATVTNRTSAGTTVPVIGEKVSFALLTANGGTIAAANDRTAGGGVATAIYTAGNNMATDTVRVITDVGATASITITKTGGIVGARISSLTASPTSVAGGGSSIIKATVTDGNSNPMQGETVTFTLPVNESGASFASSVSVTTDAGGNAVTIYRAGSISPLTAVSDTVRGALANGSGNAVIITRSAGTTTTTTDLSVSVVAVPTSVSAGQTSIITATVTGDESSGAAVTFSLPVNSSGASFINAGGSGVSSITVTASGSGIATAIYQAGSTSSSAAVQDTVQAVLTNGANGAVILTRTATTTTTTTNTVSIEASLTPVMAGQVSIITATVTNTSGSTSTPAGGVTVTFTLPVNSSGATVSAATATTDGSGKAVVTYQPGILTPTLTVQDTVQAAVGTATSAIVITRTGSAASAYSITVTAAPPTLSVIGGKSVITANVKNNLGTVVSGVPVNFTATGGATPPIAPLIATTDVSGNAVATFTGNPAGAAKATDVVTASVTDTVSAKTYTASVVITNP
jgi:adhesin/invasin